MCNCIFLYKIKPCAKWAEGIPEAGVKMEECHIWEREWETDEEKPTCASVFPLDEHQSFPFSTSLIKINHLPPSPNFTTESNLIPILDYSSACGCVRRIICRHLLTPKEVDSGSPVCFSITAFFKFDATFSQTQMRPECYLRPCWKKSLRTNPLLNFQQSWKYFDGDWI